MKVGDLVVDVYEDEPKELGLILRVIDTVEIPPLLEILWQSSYTVSKTYRDDLVVVSSSE